MSQAEINAFWKEQATIKQAEIEKDIALTVAKRWLANCTNAKQLLEFLQNQKLEPYLEALEISVSVAGEEPKKKRGRKEVTTQELINTLKIFRELNATSKDAAIAPKAIAKRLGIESQRYTSSIRDALEVVKDNGAKGKGSLHYVTATDLKEKLKALQGADE